MKKIDLSWLRRPIVAGQVFWVRRTQGLVFHASVRTSSLPPVPLACRYLPHGRALTNNYLKRQLSDAYLCFEALTDHPYALFYKHGFFPLLSERDGCNKPAVNISVEGYFRQQKEQVVDMDLDWLWLTLRMLSPMLFGSTRVQLSYSTPVAFCPQNRTSNIITISARGKARQAGDVEAADGEALADHVNGYGQGLLLKDMIDDMTKDDLDAFVPQMLRGRTGWG